MLQSHSTISSQAVSIQSHPIENIIAELLSLRTIVWQMNLDSCQHYTELLEFVLPINNPYQNQLYKLQDLLKIRMIRLHHLEMLQKAEKIEKNKLERVRHYHNKQSYNNNTPVSTNNLTYGRKDSEHNETHQLSNHTFGSIVSEIADGSFNCTVLTDDTTLNQFHNILENPLPLHSVLSNKQNNDQQEREPRLNNRIRTLFTQNLIHCQFKSSTLWRQNARPQEQQLDPYRDLYTNIQNIQQMSSTYETDPSLQAEIETEHAAVAEEDRNGRKGSVRHKIYQKLVSTPKMLADMFQKWFK